MDSTATGQPCVCILVCGVMLCVYGMAYLCGSTLVKVQAGNTAIWPQLNPNQKKTVAEEILIYLFGVVDMMHDT